MRHLTNLMTLKFIRLRYVRLQTLITRRTFSSNSNDSNKDEGSDNKNKQIVYKAIAASMIGVQCVVYGVAGLFVFVLGIAHIVSQLG